ncbi:PREDICTED: uncharacterized protein LOC105316737 [Amphimedon queenslandica]|uniref:Uncharacterized protein n=1 Tax=Amphimedon queenslandica TaxID=400682 RepID=A0A1X7VK09_AMPQE|nr:PREDICTED: uncharacterized protein LOC105316737 [Amphimedon queenslandica]|eukprot:XP_011410174.1 PREDICTED: uncharacterized protein LOC105316737 [Amphimedon queenslandica]
MANKTLQFYTPESFILGRALRAGDTEVFLLEYDRILEKLDDDHYASETREDCKLEDIKEMSRVISELPVHSYSLLEEGHLEGLLISFSHDEKNDKNSNCVETLLNKLLEYLSSKLFTDSGVSSDHDFSEVKTTNHNYDIKETTTEKTVLHKSDVQPVVAGVHVYNNGDLVKMKKPKNPPASYNGKKKKMSYSNSPIQIEDYHKRCVDLLWRKWCSIKQE